MEQQKLQKILMIASASVAALILATTVIAWVAKKGNLTDQWRVSDPTPQKVQNMSGKDSQKCTTFDLLGQLRLQSKPDSKDSRGTIIVISPWFSYPENDTPLFEELSQKSRQIKGIITSYFSELTRDQLIAIGEKKIKTELKEKINQILIMGKIQAVYFTDYLFID